MSSKIDMAGKRFGRLVVIEECGKDNCGQLMWKCKCDCGNATTVRGYSLRRGDVQSCGCFQTECSRNRAKTHGGFYTNLYRKWAGMKRRCYYVRGTMYRHYGGRGITVCDEWKNDFESFRNWSLANGYCDGLTLDRIDVNGNYCPENCRWVTQKEQQNNKRNSHLLTCNGETHTVAEWCEITGLPRGTIRGRLEKGKWSVEDALAKPVQKRRKIF
jgi:hypothetical protein